MKRRVLVTGVTGVLGESLLEGVHGEDITALVRNPGAILNGVRTAPADLCALPELGVDWDIIIHAAADTRFKAPRAELWKNNVETTRSLIAFARRCPKLQRFLYISSTCVSGNISGSIPESTLSDPPKFQNAYEESKWQAEALFPSSGLPFQIVRVPIVIGSQADGAIRRPLAIHHALRWISQGLVPFLPANPDVRLDLVSAEYVTDVIRCALKTTEPGSSPVIHACRGAEAPRIVDLLARLETWLGTRSEAWRSGVFNPPILIAPAAFADFRQLIEEIGNQIFLSIYQVTDVLTSTLTVPKRFTTSLASSVPDIAWETLCDRVFEFHISPLLQR